MLRLHTYMQFHTYVSRSDSDVDIPQVPLSLYDNAKALDQMEAAYSTLLARPVLGGTGSPTYKSRTKGLAIDGKEHPRIVTLGGDHTIVSCTHARVYLHFVSKGANVVWCCCVGPPDLTVIE